MPLPGAQGSRSGVEARNWGKARSGQLAASLFRVNPHPTLCEQPFDQIWLPVIFFSDFDFLVQRVSKIDPLNNIDTFHGENLLINRFDAIFVFTPTEADECDLHGMLWQGGTNRN